MMFKVTSGLSERLIPFYSISYIEKNVISFDGELTSITIYLNTGRNYTVNIDNSHNKIDYIKLMLRKYEEYVNIMEYYNPRR